MATGSTHLHPLEVAEYVVQFVEVKELPVHLLVSEMNQIWSHDSHVTSHGDHMTYSVVR